MAERTFSENQDHTNKINVKARVNVSYLMTQKKEQTWVKLVLRQRIVWISTWSIYF